jgi:hypothetical protein
MASFYAYDFVYDDIPSQKWDLKIITFEDGGLFNGVGSSDVNIITQRVLRKSKPYYLGRTQETVLEFPLTFGTAAPISALDRDMISAWLFGRSIYKKLYILQDDLNGAYFNCFLTKPEPLYIGGLNYAFTCNVTCDSPWAYSPEHITSGSFTGTYHTVNLYNGSSEDEYLYPTLYFQIVSATGSLVNFNLYNSSDDEDRVFIINDLSVGDEITVDNDLQIISGVDSRLTTLTGLLGNFEGYNWARLIPRNNILTLYATNSAKINYEIRYTERLKIGG